ncbi:ROK family transcriptional regulator [Kibdelosporangium phytohabitans]|uniref:Transcriptional regulator n=1 Tax=Kibdelosporangium phytohabitans TaxID=860235 RepID=A0A0N9HUS2_9PSEU|nr:ROK family transcriptional regulator [Kibdelosporangium phytohabitans]ALG05872.1 transcriptional regulator [Kibdelosporangium phytohabitans]MBE1466089.1 putative NBD/HSP70 family sugar kinase [Kibdelosporangium phytohabitans]
MPNPPTSEILRLVSSGEASSRTDLARILGLARSTVSLRVQELIDAGLLTETGDGPSRGGRRPRVLRPAGDGGYVIGADFGANHIRIGAYDLSGEQQHITEVELDIAAGPETCLGTLLDTVGGILPGQRLLGVGIGLPGPVNFEDGRVERPARMPGWHGFGVRDWLSERLDVPVAVDNDANVVAIGELHTRNLGPEHLVVVKAGTGVGCGVIFSGVAHRGANGVSGDVSHVRVQAAGEKLCACGNTGCLETIASGAALAKSVGARDTGHLVELANDAEPHATAAVRRAGGHLGEVLSTVVNFFNPHAVLLAGRLSSVEPYVAAVRGALYERCLPMATQNLTVAVAQAGRDAGPLGAGVLALHQVHRKERN